MKYYAVVDTNVLISALLSKNEDSATVKVMGAVFDGRIIPLYHRDILAEYAEVLHRKKFHFDEKLIWTVLEAVRQFGVEVFPQPTGGCPALLLCRSRLVHEDIPTEAHDARMDYLVTELGVQACQ